MHNCEHCSHCNSNVAPKQAIDTRVIIGIVFYVVAILTGNFYIIAYLLIGFDVLKKAFNNIVKGRVFDENFLMAIATIGALIINEPVEAVGVMLFYKIGEYLQQKSIYQSRQAISDLMNIKSDTANVVTGNDIRTIPSEAVKIGDIIAVYNGDKVPVDGVLTSGGAILNTSALTGESRPKHVNTGDTILSGSINVGAVLYIKATKKYKDSTVAKILNLIEHARHKKSKTENFITKFSSYYTPAVVGIAVLIAVLSPMIFGITFSESAYRSLIFLVIHFYIFLYS